MIISMSLRPKAVKFLSYISGWKATVSAGRELKKAAVIPAYFLGRIVQYSKNLKSDLVYDRELSNLNDRERWDRLVIDFNITTKSVKRKYASCSVAHFILLLALTFIITNECLHYGNSLPADLAHLFFGLFVISLVFQNAYRMNMALTQSAPKPLDFLLSCFKSPLLLISKPLPKNYKVRGEQP